MVELSSSVIPDLLPNLIKNRPLESSGYDMKSINPLRGFLEFIGLQLTTIIIPLWGIGNVENRSIKSKIVPVRRKAPARRVEMTNNYLRLYFICLCIINIQLLKFFILTISKFLNTIIKHIFILHKIIYVFILNWTNWELQIWNFYLAVI